MGEENSATSENEEAGVLVQRVLLDVVHVEAGGWCGQNKYRPEACTHGPTLGRQRKVSILAVSHGCFVDSPTTNDLRNPWISATNCKLSAKLHPPCFDAPGSTCMTHAFTRETSMGNCPFINHHTHTQQPCFEYIISRA